MIEKHIRVETEVALKVTWPSGATATFSAEELGQLLSALICDGLLVMQTSRNGRLLTDLETEIVDGPEGSFVLRPSQSYSSVSPTRAYNLDSF